MEKQKTPLLHIFAYSLGDGAYSLTMNTVWGFAMFFYTQALGLNAQVTTIILGVPLFWDAITDPVMGHITDNTRSRFGRRHPHILIGGVLMALCYFFLWYVPDVFQSSQTHIVIYLLIVNIISRTLMTWYCVPYVALGFEMCTDYNERSTLQSTRFVVNMIFNLVFCGQLVWRVFLVDEAGDIDTTIQANYMKLGFWFSLTIMLLILITVFSTRKYSEDTRHVKRMEGNSFHAFLHDMGDIFKDRNSISVFLYFTIVFFSFVFVASIQMYVYVSFMKFTETEASTVHSMGMIGFALGSLISAPLSKKFDKKGTIYIGSVINILANVVLASVFLTGLLQPGMYPFWITSVAGVVFWIFQASFWFGSGFLLPIGFSMIADVSEINRLKTGIVKDGGYSAVLSFLTKVTQSVALILTGTILTLVDFQEGSDVQTPEVAGRLFKTMVFLGITFTLIAVFFIRKYPITKEKMEEIKAEYESDSMQDVKNAES